MMRGKAMGTPAKPVLVLMSVGLRPENRHLDADFTGGGLGIWQFADDQDFGRLALPIKISRFHLCPRWCRV